MIAFWEIAISLVLEIAWLSLAKPSQRIALSNSVTFTVASDIFPSKAKPAGFVQMLSESGIFSRGPYTLAIVRLIYQKSDENQAICECGDEKQRFLLTEFLVNILTF